MSLPELSGGAQRVLDTARAEAERHRHDAIGVEHLLLALLSENEATREIFRRLNLDQATATERLEQAARRSRARADGGTLSLTSNARRVIDAAGRSAREQGSTLTAEHLLRVVVAEPRGTIARMLGEAGVASETVETTLAELLTGKGPVPVPRVGPPSPTKSPRQHTGGGKGPREASTVAPPGAPRWRYVLLAAVPVSMLLGYVLHAASLWVFITACLGVLPLASYMGEATEHLSARTGPTIGGLLNATFGNAAELIIAIVALRAGLVDLVKASITGSILGNLLLILGLSLVAAGLKRPELKFNRTTAGMSAGMMALAVVAMVFPALYHSTHPAAGRQLAELRMSEGVSLILLTTYGLSLLFTLKTHRRLFGGGAHPTEGPTWSVGRAVLTLALATVGVAIESELLVHAAEAATEAVGISPVFLGLIIIPIIGNAAEHAAAVVLSRKGQIDLGLQIALGSSAQVALLIAPILVFVGVLLGVNMNLVFSPFEVMALGLATIVTAIITLDGESHWFEGVQLLAVYLMLAVGAYFL